MPPQGVAMLRLALIGHAASVMFILTAMALTLRYRFDFAPFVTLAALIGYRSVALAAAEASDDRRKVICREAAVALCVLGIVGSHATADSPQGLRRGDLPVVFHRALQRRSRTSPMPCSSADAPPRGEMVNGRLVLPAGYFFVQDVVLRGGRKRALRLRRILFTLAVALALASSPVRAAALPSQPAGTWKAVLIAGDDEEAAFDNAVDAALADIKLAAFGVPSANIAVLKSSGRGC